MDADKRGSDPVHLRSSAAQGFAATLCCRKRWISFFINSASLASGCTFKNISNSSAASLYRFN
jgi:hypothetical protein